MNFENYITSKSTIILNIILFIIQFDTFEFVHTGGLGFFSPFRTIILPLSILYLCNASKCIYPNDKWKIIISIIFFIFCYLGDIGSDISNLGSVIGNFIALLTAYYLFHNVRINRSTLYVITSWAAIQIPSFIIEFSAGRISVFNRFEGLNFDPNYLCSLVIPAIWASIYLLKSERNVILRLYNYGIIALSCSMVYLSYSRGGLIALVLILFLYLLVYNKKFLIITITILISITSTFILRAQFIDYRDAEENYIDGFIYRNFKNDDASEMTSGRSDFISIYLEEIDKGNYIIFGTSLPQYIRDVNNGGYSHNGIIDLCVQGGLIVGGLFVVLLFICIVYTSILCITTNNIPYEFIFILSIFFPLLFLAFSAKLIWVVIGILLSISNEINFEKYLNVDADYDFNNYD